ncbi:hypothetical protein [Desmospora activa]|uniref:Uncharacterized protein n=1 Tax=Desmospora activa DSM 45169 TaxID=1121389 RepID=A0A2T4YZM5_9BACL|nr:hypothetical protein [Desmospora activa]PTM52692.1 hypothetical protein C8J48_3685 [Desmospora activa DSM 45169]
MGDYLTKAEMVDVFDEAVDLVWEKRLTVRKAIRTALERNGYNVQEEDIEHLYEAYSRMGYGYPDSRKEGNYRK